MNDENNPQQTTNAPAEVVPINRKRRRKAQRRGHGVPYHASEKEAVMTALQLHNNNIDDFLRANPELAHMRRSLYYWKERGIRPNGEMSEYVANLLDSVTLQCLDLLPEKLPTASVRDIVGAMHISIDKALLLRGQATSITATVDLRKEVAEVLGVTIDVLPE